MMKRATAAACVMVLAGMACGFAASAEGSSRPASGAAGESFSIVVLPDTQIYAMAHPEIFHSQTQWVADNAAKENIKIVLHLGDVTNDNVEKQWLVARKAFDRIAGKVPFSIVPGNHDTGPGGNTRSRDGGLGRHFPMEELKKAPTFGGVYDKEPGRADNSWHVFTAGGRKWLTLGLEFGPRNDVLRWANEVVAAHPDCQVIVFTHAYLSQEGQRFSRKVKGQFAPPHGYATARSPEGSNDGQEMWEKFVSKHSNIRLVISGHVGPAARHTDTGAAGNVVHEMVVDYQTIRHGGDGYLRVLRFPAGAERVDVVDYSPTLKTVYPNPAMKFSLDLSAGAGAPVEAGKRNTNENK